MLRMKQPLDLVVIQGKFIYLAGSMGKVDWQSEVYKKLVMKSLSSEWTVLNPRPDQKALEVKAYASWEYNCVIASDIIGFWFAAKDRPDMGLFDLGRWSVYEKPMIVGIEKGYAFEERIKCDLAVSCPELTVLKSIEAVADAIAVKAKEIDRGA